MSDVQSDPPAVNGPDAWPVPFWSGARITHRKFTFWSRFSRMSIDATGRLIITSKKGVDLDVHIADLRNLHAPLWMLMCGLYFEAAGKKWYVTFSEIVNVDWSALQAFGPSVGLASAELEDLSHQALLSMVWLMLLDPAPPAPKAAEAPSPAAPA